MSALSIANTKSHADFKLNYRTVHPGLVKGKVISVTDSAGSWGCDTLRLTHFLDTWHTDGGEDENLNDGHPSASGRF
jgi:hypothetical protein